MKITITRNNNHTNKDGRLEFIEKMLDQLDALYDDLTYQNNAAEIACIERKIKAREEMLAYMWRKVDLAHNK